MTTKTKQVGCETANETDPFLASDTAANGEVVGEIEKCSAICYELQTTQRRRVPVMRARIRIDNELGAIVANEMGYSSGMTEKERKALRATADDLVEAIDREQHGNGRKTKKAEALAALLKEHETVADNVRILVVGTRSGRNVLQHHLESLESEMEVLAAKLPVAAFVESVRGFGILSLGILIGETGDFANYANPGKVWRRMGLAPYKGKMSATWRSGMEGKLTKAEWEDNGYSPRRRSIAYVMGEGLMKQNEGGAYRKRYEEARTVVAVTHPDWSKGRSHKHGMLLCIKLFVKHLWVEWNKNGRIQY